MKIPDKDDIDGQRKLFFDSFPGEKTIQLIPEVKNIKYPYNIPKVVHLPGGIYPEPEIPDGFLYDRSEWIPFPYIKRMEDFNLGGACISLTINETDKKGRKKENIVKIRSLFSDFDNVPLPPSWVLEPSMIVETSNGKYHAYWFVEDFPLEMFSQTQSAIAYKYKTDESMKDITKALRIPSFYHNKKEPFLTRIIKYSGLKYSVRDFDCFPPEAKKQWSASKYNTVKNNSDQKFLGTYGTGKGGRNCHVAKRVGGMIAKGLSWGKIEVEAMKEAVACTPSLSESETLAILKSLRRY